MKLKQKLEIKKDALNQQEGKLSYFLPAPKVIFWGPRKDMRYALPVPTPGLMENVLVISSFQNVLIAQYPHTHMPHFYS